MYESWTVRIGTFLSVMLVNAGHSLYEVQQSLGHSDPRGTMRYAHLSKDSLHQAANSASQKIMAAWGQ